MIVEGEKSERLLKLARPNGAEVMKITGTQKRKRTKISGMLRSKGVDFTLRRDEPQPPGFLAHIDDRHLETMPLGNKIPRVIGTEKGLVGRRHKNYGITKFSKLTEFGDEERMDEETFAKNDFAIKSFTEVVRRQR